MDSFRRFLGNSPRNPQKLPVYSKFTHQEIRWKSLYFTHYLFLSTFSFLLFLYTTSWRYNKDFPYASIDIWFYIMFYIINTMKQDLTLLYYVRTYKTKKVPIWTCPPPTSLFVVTPLFESLIYDAPFFIILQMKIKKLWSFVSRCSVIKYDTSSWDII